MIRFIAAIDAKKGLANDTGIPWKIPKDSQYFKEQTLNGLVVMGYRTYEEFKLPLNSRQNFVATRENTPVLRPGFVKVSNIDKFIADHRDKLVWIIGGAGLFSQTIEYADELYLTQIHKDFHCTKFFPEYEKEFQIISRSKESLQNDITFNFEVWKRDVLNKIETS